MLAKRFTRFLTQLGVVISTRALWHLCSDVIITAVISVEPYLVDKGLHTALDKINRNVDFKTSNIIIIIIVRILYYSYTTPACVNTYTHTCMH